MSVISSPAPLVVQPSGFWYNNEGSWSTFKIEVGDFFKLAPSGSRIRNLLSGSAFIPSTSISTITTSQLQRTLDSKWDEFSGYQLTILDYFHLGLTYNCSLGYDTVGVGEEPKKLENFVVAAVEGSDLPVEYLGLNSSPLIVPGKEPLDPKEVPSFLAALKERLHIPSLSFGYQAGAAHRYNKVDGSLVLGGYDLSRMSNDTLSVPIIDDLIVGIQSITADVAGNQTNLLDNGILAYIDSNLPYLWLPDDACDAFEAAFGLVYESEKNIYVIPESINNALQKKNTTISFTMGTAVAGGETIKIDLPYSAFNLQTTSPISSELTTYFPIKRSLNQTYILGRSFLQEAYLTVDWERDTFSLSQARFTAPMPTPEIITIQPVTNWTDWTTAKWTLSHDSRRKVRMRHRFHVCITGLGIVILLLILRWIVPPLPRIGGNGSKETIEMEGSMLSEGKRRPKEYSTAFHPVLQIVVPLLRIGYTRWNILLAILVPRIAEEQYPYSVYPQGINDNVGATVCPRPSGHCPRLLTRVQRKLQEFSGIRDSLFGTFHHEDFTSNAETNNLHTNAFQDNGVQDEGQNKQNASSTREQAIGESGTIVDSNDCDSDTEVVDEDASEYQVDQGDLESAKLYLHIIMPDWISGKKQISINVTRFRTDYHLSVELNRTYRKHRGRWRALFTVKALRPTKYELFNSTNVRTFYDPSDLPSTMPDLNNPPLEYIFSYQPLHPTPEPPLLHQDQLTRLFQHPACSIYHTEQGRIHDRQCYDRSPKRRGILTYTPNMGFPTGYGFEFVESFNIKFVLTCELFIAFVAFVLAGLYFGLAKEDQKSSTAVNIAMFVFLFGQFLYGVVLALGERFEAWRF